MQLHDFGSGSDAAVTVPANPNKSEVITYIVASYATAPTGGYLEVKAGSEVIFKVQLTAVGPFVFEPYLQGNRNETMTITLKTSGSIHAYLNVRVKD